MAKNINMKTRGETGDGSFPADDSPMSRAGKINSTTWLQTSTVS